jgi:hypothetical protein
VDKEFVDKEFVDKEFGIRFKVGDKDRFESLRRLFYKVKVDKENDSLDPQDWPDLVPAEVKPNFEWPTEEERQKWLSVRDTTIVVYGEAGDHLSAKWDFYRVFESLEEGEYSLVSCELTDEGIGEMHIDPEAYPYGGVGPQPRQGRHNNKSKYKASSGVHRCKSKGFCSAWEN